MNASILECECCGSRNIRRAHLEGLADHLRVWIGRQPVRCAACGNRSYVNLIEFSNWRWAKCPGCLQMELGTWNPKHYRLRAWPQLLVRLGAHRYRCHTCRRNFVSFRGLWRAAAPVVR